jgi:hypothetical protein
VELTYITLYRRIQTSHKYGRILSKATIKKHMGVGRMWCIASVSTPRNQNIWWFTNMSENESVIAGKRYVKCDVAKRGRNRRRVLHGLSPHANYTDRLNDRRLSAKLVPTLADRGCRVVSATIPPQSLILGIKDPSRYFHEKSPQI